MNRNQNEVPSEIWKYESMSISNCWHNSDLTKSSITHAQSEGTYLHKEVPNQASFYRYKIS